MSYQTFITATREAAAAGFRSWSLSELSSKSPAFRDVWSVASAIPGYLDDCSAVALFQVIENTRPARIVEIGSYLGRSTVLFARSLRALGIDGRVTAIDPHTGDRQQLEKLGSSHLATRELFLMHLAATDTSELVEPMFMTSDEAAASWKDPIDFLYVDGWHSYEAVMSDGEHWLPFLQGGVAVFDDVLRYAEVNQAVRDLAAKGYQLYGIAFGQAYVGLQRDAPEYVKRILRANHRFPAAVRTLTNRLPRK